MAPASGVPGARFAFPRLIAIRPSAARRAATRRTAAIHGRQSSGASERATSEGQIDFPGPRAATSSRIRAAMRASSMRR